jgi:hypothetical protein
LTLSTEATAVPHPDQAMTAALDPGSDGGPTALAPPGYALWSHSPWSFEGGEAPARPATTRDGALALLFGPDGLVSARTDGSDAAAPTLIAPGSGLTVLGGAQPFHPDGRSLLLSDGSRLLVARAGVAASAVGVGPDWGRTIVAAHWALGGTLILVHLAGGPVGQAAPLDEGLWVVPADGGGPPAPVHPAGVTIDGLAALTPGGDGAVFVSRDEGDSALFLAPLAGGAPALAPRSLTPHDDAAEAFVGFAP